MFVTSGPGVASARGTPYSSEPLAQCGAPGASTRADAARLSACARSRKPNVTLIQLQQRGICAQAHGLLEVQRGFLELAHGAVDPVKTDARGEIRMAIEEAVPLAERHRLVEQLDGALGAARQEVIFRSPDALGGFS